MRARHHSVVDEAELFGDPPGDVPVGGSRLRIVDQRQRGALLGLGAAEITELGRVAASVLRAVLPI